MLYKSKQNYFSVRMSENNSDDDIKKNYNGKRKRKSDESFAEKKIKIEVLSIFSNYFLFNSLV